MSKCPNCGKFVLPNILGKDMVQCKKCLSFLVEIEKNANTARIGFTIIAIFFPAVLFTLTNLSTILVFIVVAPLSIFYLNWATQYKIHKKNEEHENNKTVPPYK